MRGLQFDAHSIVAADAAKYGEIVEKLGVCAGDEVHLPRCLSQPNLSCCNLVRGHPHKDTLESGAEAHPDRRKKEVFVSE